MRLLFETSWYFSNICEKVKNHLSNFCSCRWWWRIKRDECEKCFLWLEIMELPVEVIFCLLINLLVSCVDSVRVHYLHWNSTNPIFRIDNTDHIMDVNQGNLPWEYDQLNIICPAYQRGTRHTDSAEKYIIYNVSKEEYDSCRISQNDPRVVAVCDKPDRELQFTITFR